MDLKELEKDLDRQWEAAQLRADKAIDEWLAKDRRRIVEMRQTRITLVDILISGSWTFDGVNTADARAQAAQYLYSMGYAK